MIAQPNLSLERLIEDKAQSDSGYAIAYALLRLAAAQDRTATQLKYLGLGDASTQMGAVEMLAIQAGKIAEGLDGVAASVNAVGLEISATASG